MLLSGQLGKVEHPDNRATQLTQTARKLTVSGQRFCIRAKRCSRATIASKQYSCKFCCQLWPAPPGGCIRAEPPRFESGRTSSRIEICRPCSTLSGYPGKLFYPGGDRVSGRRYYPPARQVHSWSCKPAMDNDNDTATGNVHTCSWIVGEPQGPLLEQSPGPIRSAGSLR